MSPSSASPTWLEAPVPENEAERLAELYALDLLDTPPEERYDRIVRVSAFTFRVPIVYVALVDADRQWFKAQCGLVDEETGRKESFCGHTILESEPLVIPDTHADPRFASNPLVVGEPFVRFYAGHPLRGPGGQAVGTLCLVDREPRELAPEELGAFRELAAMVEQELGLVRLVQVQRELLETQSSLVETQKLLAEELEEAADYVRSLLPPPLDDPRIKVRSKHVCSSQLGGDIFGYRWLDDDRLAVWVLDVCGHGVGASLLSITAHDALRADRLRRTDYSRPAEVLEALNRAFPMEDHQYKFFSAWYGIYDTRDRTLTYACGGHPPALALLPGEPEARRLGESSLLVGTEPDPRYEEEETALPPGTRLYLFSDGVFEVEDEDGDMLGLDGFARLLARVGGCSDSCVEEIYSRAVERRGAEELEDDFSLLELQVR